MFASVSRYIAGAFGVSSKNEKDMYTARKGARNSRISHIYIYVQFRTALVRRAQWRSIGLLEVLGPEHRWVGCL